MNIIQFLLFISNESCCAELLRTARWNGLIICPYCSCGSIKGMEDTRSTFRDTSVIGAAAHSTIRRGQFFTTPTIAVKMVLAHLLYCISSLAGTSIREASKKLEMQYRTSYCMTRKIMQKLFDSQKALTINGCCETDELYVHAGMKGKNYHDKIMESGRLPRRRAIKPPLGRGRFSRDFPMVMCYHQKGGDTVDLLRN